MELSYASDGTLKTVESPFAGAIEFVRDEQKRVIRVDRVRDGLSYHYAYHSDGRLASSSDFENHKTEYEYAPSSDPANAGLLSVIRDPLGREIRSIYDAQGRVVEQHEPGNAVRSFSYTSANASTSVTTVDEIDRGISRYYFDSRQLLTKIEHPDGMVEQQVWNSRNLLERKVIAGSSHEEFTYDSRGNRASIKRPADWTPTYIEYDSKFDRPVKITPPAGAPTRFVLDDRTGDIRRIERSSAGTTLALDFEYDSFGNRTKVSNGLTSYSDATDENGLKVSVYDSRNPEARSYDSRGRLKARAFKSGRVLSYTYDAHDRILRLDDSHGPDLVLVYDIVGRITSRTVTDGKRDQVTTFRWDARDRLLEVVDPIGNRKSFEYDDVSLNRVLDQPVAEIDAAGNRTVYTYDSRQRLLTTTNEKGEKTILTYDFLGFLRSITDGSGNASYLYYDANGRLESRLYESVRGNPSEGKPGFDVEYYSRDGAGRLYWIARNNYLGGTDGTIYVYDAWDRIIEKSVYRENFLGERLSEETSAFRYSPQLDQNLLIEAKNEVAHLNFAHDLAPPFLPKAYGLKAVAAGNPLNLVESEFSISRGVTNEIDLIKEISSGKSVFSAKHDPAGRLLELASGTIAGTKAGSLLFALSYDGFGRRTSLDSSEKIRQLSEYDDLNRLREMAWTRSGSSKSILTSILSKLIGGKEVEQELTYDPVGNIISQKREFGSFDYSYDAIHQLEKVDAKGRGIAISNSHLNRSFDQSFEYDPAGNRTLATLDGGKADFRLNQILSNERSTFEYDESGHGQIRLVRNKGGRSARKYNYRIDGKLESFELVVDSDWDGDSDDEDAIVTKASYYYDALGRRIAKKVVEKRWEKFPKSKWARKRKLGLKEYAYTHTYGHLANEDRIVLAKSADGMLSLYLDGNGIDEHLGKISKREKKVFLTDHLGSVLNSPLGGEFKAYGAFGTSTFLGNIMSQFRRDEPVMYGFTGREFDPESGLYYYRARMYDPRIGRFMTRDPIGFAGGDVNLYRSPRNSPLMYVDPTGLIVVDHTGAIPSVVKNSPIYRQLNALPQLIHIVTDFSLMAAGEASPLVNNQLTIRINPANQLNRDFLLDTYIHELNHALRNIQFNNATSEETDTDGFLPEELDKNLGGCNR